MPTLRFMVGAAALSCAIACGGSKPSPLTLTTPGGAGGPAAPLGPPSRVGPPPGLFAVARLSNPAKVADTGVSWSTLPIDWRALLGKEAPGLDQVLDLQASIDVAAMLDPASAMEPNVFWAFSLGATSADAAARFFRSQGSQVVEESPSAYRIQVESDLACRVGPARGLARARIVCSADAESTTALAPYMSRGMPEESFGPAELHVHVAAEAFRRRYGSQIALVRTMGVPFALRELSLDAPKFDRALRDTLYALADEVVALSSDVDRLDLNAAFTPANDAVDFGLTLAFSGQKSWWAETLARAVGRAAPPPDFFWKLPADSTSASYSVHSDPERARPIAAGLGALLDGFLEHHKLSDRRRVALVAALESVFGTSAKSAYAALPTPSFRLDEIGDSKDMRAIVNAAMGAHLFVVDGGGDRITLLASEMVKSLGDRPFREHLTKSKLVPKDRLPTARERAPRGRVGMPRGTRVFELELPLGEEAGSPPGRGGKGTPSKGKGESLSVVLVAVPDGPLTWFGFGIDEKTLVGRIADLRAGLAATLVTREGLTSVRSDPGLSGGFSSAAAALSGLPDMSARKGTTIDRLPHRGQTVMPWRLVVEPGGGGPKLVATSRVPRAVAEDFVALTGTYLTEK